MKSLQEVREELKNEKVNEYGFKEVGNLYGGIGLSPAISYHTNSETAYPYIARVYDQGLGSGSFESLEDAHAFVVKAYLRIKCKKEEVEIWGEILGRGAKLRDDELQKYHEYKKELEKYNLD